MKKPNSKSFLEIVREGLSKIQGVLISNLKKGPTLEELGEVYTCIQNGSSSHKFTVLEKIDDIVSDLNELEKELNLPISELKTELASGSQRKKIKRATNAEKIKETLMLQSKGVLADCRGTNHVLPPGVLFCPGKVIREPEYGMFYIDPFNKQCFQRASDIPIAKTQHLVAIKYFGEGWNADPEFIKLMENELKKRMAEDNSEKYARIKREYEDSLE